MADQSSWEQASPAADTSTTTSMGESSADVVGDRADVPTAMSASASTSTTMSTSAGGGGGGGGGVLQGTLLYRRNLSAKKMPMWKSSMRMYTVLDMAQQQASPPDASHADHAMSGSLTCYRFEGLSKREASAAYAPTELQSGGSVRYQGMSNVRTCLELPPHLPWSVRDVENDASAFLVEIPVKEGLASIKSRSNDDGAVAGAAADVAADSYDDDDDNNDDDEDYDYAEDEDDDGMYVFWGDGDDEEGDDVEDSTRTAESASGSEILNMVAPNQVEVDLLQAAARRRPYVRYAFRCPTKRSEKALWLTAFQKVDRLTTESRRKRSLFGTSALSSVSTIRQSNSRMRRGRGVDLARQSMKLDKDAIGENGVGGVGDGLESTRTDDAVKEYRVRPNYNYPHRWMTHEELTEEMLAASAEIHDLRLPPAIAPRQEIGLLRVEVLQCLGLPRPKGKTSASVNPNPVVYLVCGSYAFATDIVPQCTDPMWLKGMRRACQIPISHGYARLFVGVFHDDGSKSSKDLFIGRAVIEVPRLRPGATYDVTLPLRQSASVYSRRKRGAVRLRFSLDLSDEKQLVLSYFPSKRNRVAGQIGTTTVACADPKSFRNVALTVNGIHLPGKFSTDHFMAIIREFKFVQKVIRRLLVKFIEDLMVWRYPVKSAFVFIAWMHSLHVNSATMIPVYIVSFIFLQLMANYARCIVAGAEFRPATWEEIFGSLTGSGAKKMHALDDIVDEYDPIGQSLFTLLGFMGKKDEYFVGNVDTFALDEFPYASLAGYPKLSVDEAVAKAPANQTALEIHAETDKGNDDDEADDDGFDLIDNIQTSNNLIDRAVEEYQPRIYFKKRIPQQNIDLKVKGDGKSIADELMEIEEKIQKATKYAFRDNAYLITDPSQPPFGKRSRENDEYNVERDLNKLLGIGQFSQWNPIVSKYSVQFEPIIRICVVFLSVYRSIYNIFTWRDPYLSFWFSVVCLASTFVMVLFPWRPCLLVLGVVAFGPQNWLIRLFRELVWSADDENRPGRFLRAFRELLKSSDDDDEGDDDTADGKKKKAQDEVEGEPQPVFFAHAPASKPLLERKDAVNSAQHVVIPYSPLLSQRFYDWPPDKKYARITKATLKDTPLRSSSEKAITKVNMAPPATPPKKTPRRQEDGKLIQGKNKEKETTQASPPRPASTPSLSSNSSIKSSTRNVGGRIVLSLQGSPSKDNDEEEQSDVNGTQTLKSASPSAASASTIATTTAASSSLASKAKSTLAAQASRSVGVLSKSIAEKGQDLKRSVNFTDDISMLSKTSSNSTGKGKMGRLIKSKLSTGIIKSKKGPRIGGEISVPEEVKDEDWLKMPEPLETKEGAETSQDETGTDDDGDIVQHDPTLEATTADYGIATIKSTVDDHAAETDGGRDIQEEFAMSTPAESTSVEDKEPTTESSDKRTFDSSPFVDEKVETKDILDAKGSEEASDAIESVGQPNVEAPIDSTVVEKSERDEEFSGDVVDKVGNDYSSASESIPAVGEEHKEKAMTLDQNAIIESDLPPTSLVSAAQSPSNEAAALLETLMEVKLELATARTENDHYRARLKETEEERDYYKNKYNECMEEKDTRTPNWLANGEDEGSPPPAPPSRQQNQFGFKMNMTSMSSPFRKQPPFK